MKCASIDIRDSKKGIIEQKGRQVLEEESSKAGGLSLNTSKTKIMTTDQLLYGTLKVGNNMR